MSHPVLYKNWNRVKYNKLVIEFLWRGIPVKLFVYDHCPYCVKARMIFGLKSVPFELVTLLNDDEDTPISMIGAKMVPILEKEDGSFMPESMDIVQYIDASYGEAPVLKRISVPSALEHWMDEAREYYYPLCMPRWAQAPLEEFATQGAIDYFTRKKEAFVGPFADAMAQSEVLIANANAHLQRLKPLIQSENSVLGERSEMDIHLFAMLRSLSIVKGLSYPSGVEAYRNTMGQASGVPLHDDIAI